MSERTEYVAWIDRVRATYQAVSYTCGHRLRNPELGERVAVGVIRGLIARPTVFRYQGLPYSGRIATLAEERLVAAREGRLDPVGGWSELLAGLVGLDEEVQRVVVLTCVHGQDGPELASSLGCDHGEATRRRAAAIERLRAIALELEQQDEGGARCRSTGAR